MKIVQEFREFISKGNVIDLAVGVIIGTAFGKIVTSLVNDMIMPALGILLGKINFTDLIIKIGNSEIHYGNFIQEVINFLIIAVVIFFFIKGINKLNRKKKQEKEKQEKVEEDVRLLREIRDQLRKLNSK
jgi:large conductance mechanosensitive channel